VRFSSFFFGVKQLTKERHKLHDEKCNEMNVGASGSWRSRTSIYQGSE